MLAGATRPARRSAMGVDDMAVARPARPALRFACLAAGGHRFPSHGPAGGHRWQTGASGAPNRCLTALLLLACSVAAGSAFAAEQSGVRKVSDIVFAEIGDRKLMLDLYLPKAEKHAAVVVYVHGGAWRSGSRSSMPLAALLGDGFAVASVDYRLSPEARFPAQVHDIKAAIRFLRGNQERYAYAARKIAIAGSSAGGHLAALVGVTNGSAEHEGTVGAYREQSSDVQAAVSYFGASNLLTILQQSTPRGLGVRVPALELLLGGQPETETERARLASPVFHVDRSDPPLLLLHGDQDPQMPINQAHELHGSYKACGLPVTLHVLHGAAHGGQAFYDDSRTRLVSAFLSEHVR